HERAGHDAGRARAAQRSEFRLRLQPRHRPARQARVGRDRAPPREGPQGPAECPGRYRLAYATRKSEEGAFVSPRWSSSRGAVLLSVAECSELVGRSKRTIWNWLRDDSVYREDHY